MKKTFFYIFYILGLFTINMAFISFNRAEALRAPAVDPMTEVSIENDSHNPNNRTPNNNETIKGFDFNNNQNTPNRMPANIDHKLTKLETFYSYFGPAIFFLALCLGLWIIIAKKSKYPTEIEDESAHVFNFNRYTNKKDSEQDKNDDHDDYHLPKVS